MIYDQDGFRDLKEALFALVSQDTENELKIDLKIAIDTFFDEKIYQLDREELIEYLDSPNTLVRSFKAFLNQLK